MNYYAKIIQEKRNAQKEPKIFRVFGEPFDISTVGGMKQAADAIEYHYKRKKKELGFDKAEEWKAKIGHELMVESRKR